MTEKQAGSKTEQMPLKDNPHRADLDQVTSPAEWLADRIRATGK